MSDRVLDMRYELEKLIGTGGMADVYLARDSLLDRSVAIKIIHKHFRNDAQFIDKFYREAQTAAKMSHPNIVNVYDVGMNGEDYIVMEYVPGRTLKEVIQERGALTLHDAISFAGDIASALAHAHSLGLVHCDVKPHNILVMPDGSAKVADFGIAKVVSEATMTYSGNIIGSVHYFSPEQARGSNITPQSDVYSLGVVMYEMLTGELPFTGDTSVSVALKQIQEEARPVREINPSIPQVVEDLIMRAMSKDPNMRPTSAELVRAIELIKHTLRGKIPKDPYATQMLPQIDSSSKIEKAKRVHSRNESKYDYRVPESILKSKPFIVSLILILTLGFCIGAFLSIGKFWSSTEVTVPAVAGKQLALARQILEDAKLRVNVSEVYSADVAPGEVVSQTPEAGVKVKEGRMITINVSKGGETVEMPDLQGVDRSAAEEKLKKMGLKLGSVSEKYADGKSEVILEQDPKAGTKIHRGQTVDITVSKQKEKASSSKTSVADVRGSTESSARSILEGQGLSVSVDYRESSQSAGTVISQSPSAGVEVTSGSTVVIAISKGSGTSSSYENGNAVGTASTAPSRQIGGNKKQ